MSTLIDMVFSTGFKEILVHMLCIYANCIVEMIKLGVYGHLIKLITPFHCENIILSEN